VRQKPRKVPGNENRRGLSHINNLLFCLTVRNAGKNDHRRSSERQRVSIDMLYKLVSMIAWACLLFVAWATLSPASLRPRLLETAPASIVLLEHFGAFAVIGFLFSVTYPRTALICLLVLGSAVILELLQLVVPDRDARVVDAVEKLIGGGAGIIAAKIMCPRAFAKIESDEPAPGKGNEMG
jgi:VanZ family protein